MWSRQAIAFVLVAVLPGAACRRSAGSPNRAAADAAPRITAPAEIPPPGAFVNAREFDVPISWLYLPEDPAPTGTAPNVIVGAVLPCGFQLTFGNVSPPESPLQVRVHAAWRGQGTPDRNCTPTVNAVQTMSLQRLRLGDFEVTDGTPHGANDPPTPRVHQHIVADDNNLPAVMLRRVRRCDPANEQTSCTAGGYCAQVPGRTGVGICVPPLDPYLNANRPCTTGNVEVVMQRPSQPGRIPTAPMDVHACLPACSDSQPCTAPLVCTEFGAVRACAPQ